tara:strand:+ start:12352 stop:12825 length:474 start_codon:yes stop_codon:yes gene_type:complete
MIKARAIMTENVITINDSATLTEASRLMVNKHVKSLLVMKNKTPIAVVTQNDLIKGSLNKISSKVKGVMNKKFLVVEPDASYAYLIKKLKNEKIGKFPVVENNNLVGIITETDLVEATRDFTKFHQIMQEVILTVFGLMTAFFLFFFSPLGQSIFRG